MQPSTELTIPKIVAPELEKSIKTATVRATATAASYGTRPTARISVTVLGTALPLWAATGIAVGAGSYTSALTHDLIFLLCMLIRDGETLGQVLWHLPQLQLPITASSML